MRLLPSVLRSPMRCIVVRSLLVLSCLVLILNVLFYIFNARRLDQPLEAYFLNPLTPRDKDLLDRTFRAFIEAVEAANLTYFIIGGTLLGSLRHHNRIPWDDDVDVIMNASDKPLIAKTLSKLGPDYALLITGSDTFHFQWKFYPTNGRYMVDAIYRPPYVDLFFYVENETHIWNANPQFSTTELWLKRHVFPLHRRPYGELSLAAPCNALAAMGSDFSIAVCRGRSFNHMTERLVAGDVLSVPCSRLAHIYPFVRSHQMNGSLFVQETLMLGRLSIKNTTTRAPC